MAKASCMHLKEACLLHEIDPHDEQGNRWSHDAQSDGARHWGMGTYGKAFLAFASRQELGVRD